MTVPVAMMEPVAPATVISAAPSVPDTPVGASSNDLFSDVDVKTEKVLTDVQNNMKHVTCIFCSGTAAWLRRQT